MEDANKICAFCPTSLTGANRTKEHVIPNSIGGRLKTSNFICTECNNKMGEIWDSELAEQLNWFSLSLGITRERGLPPGQLVNTVDGRQYTLLPDGSFSPKSSHTEELVDGKKRISMVSRSINEAKKRLDGVARKHPNFDLDKALSNLSMETEYLDSPLTINLQFGGHNAGRSLVKTALAFASHCGISHDELKQATAFLLDIKTPAQYGQAYLSDLIINRDKETIFHCVSLKSDTVKKRLWSYIEYFGVLRAIILINDNYNGQEIDKTYSINPITGEEAKILVSSEISDEEFFKVINGDGFDYKNQLAAFDFALPIVIKRSEQRALDDVIKRAFEHATNTLGIPEDAEIPLDKTEHFVQLIMEKLTPYISSRVRGNSPKET